ncbi:A-type flagellin [Austwickia sp. TVS 96-490-7B]|uniref:flagellin N-terminal helical domain-containing protein n=1 Tax=Austwickia sp. TVS 96-490-7B TaxID=2830843 RepID=UPI001C578710|nr:flagellin [Austwickia sp. TVS 96-490-7B]MBW3087047.1 A-type flagellin [Austwickia sp. TVS 96-490-7B]
MGLQINTNVAALNSYRNLTGTQSSMQTSLERLSSGLRINRAADDAAGLAISEKLRSQVSGLNQAQANAQDGVSLIQTAEGALNEVHSILQRMRTLAVQSSSDTNTNEDRAQIQKEVVALGKELNGISTRTQFNGMNLLDGTFGNKNLQIGANTGQTMDVNIAALSGDSLSMTTGGVKALTGGKLDGTVSTTGPVAAGTYSVVAGTSGNLDVMLDNKKVGVVSAADNKNIVLDSGATIKGASSWAAGSSMAFISTNFSATVTTGGAATGQVGNVNAGTYTITGTDVTDNMGKKVGSVTGNDVTFDSSVGGGKVSFTTAPSGTITVASFGAGIDLSTQQTASAALGKIDAAIKTVSDQRSELGALQNRLDHTIKNLGVSSENLAASESRIRDTDMAKEMTNFTRSQILQQAGVSMLAQANQSSQSVLKLLG